MTFQYKTPLFFCALAAAIAAFVSSFGPEAWMFLISYLILSYVAVQTISDLFFDARYIPKLFWIVLFGLAYAVSWGTNYSKFAFATGIVFLIYDFVWLCYVAYKKQTAR